MVLLGTLANTTNLTCYQCEKHNEQECDPKDLKPCAASFDRCAIQFTKNAQQGLFIKRTCGLGPCGFDDDMMTKGLGMECDRSKDSYWDSKSGFNYYAILQKFKLSKILCKRHIKATKYTIVGLVERPFKFKIKQLLIHDTFYRIDDWNFKTLDDVIGLEPLYVRVAVLGLEVSIESKNNKKKWTEYAPDTIATAD
ncbi:unnamed protein product [Ceutorhynchus assimilis]|uniref:Uncharacterized protein n=1 Tax=Ceutorhynchus assimilis TaxID=467358 RepID=A0A9N9Q951_9CUCU|nr:unnamed protein product [Ceutorhynchus assimilis]